MNTSHSVNAPAAILAALVLSSIGALFYNMLPLYLGLAQDARGLNAGQAGLISGAFFFGYNIATLSAFFWIRRSNWRRVTLVAAPVAALTLYAGVLVGNYTQLLLVTAVAGAAFAAIYGIGTTAIGDTRHPSRWYGVKIAMEAGTGAILFLVLPATLVATHGFEGLVLGMIIAMALLSPLAWRLPAFGTRVGEEDVDLSSDTGATRGAMPGVWLSLVALLLFFAAQTTVWAFIERLGSAGGFPTQAVGNLLSVTLVFAVMGSLTCAALGERYGNVIPFFVSGILYLCSLLALTESAQFGFYALGACAVTYSFGMGLPYAVARVAELDKDGRYVVLTVPAVGTGAMLGPPIAGALSSGPSLAPVLSFGATMMVAAVLLMAMVRRQLANS